MMKRLSIVLVTGCATASPQPAPAEHEHGHHRFDRAEEWAKVFDDPARDERQQPARVIAELALEPTSIVADVGAGTGYFSVRLAAHVPRGKVIATDIEPDMVRYVAARARREGLANLEARLATQADPALPPASVDRILVVDVWHHLEDRVGYARALAAALRPGGALLVVDFTLDAERGPPKQMRLAPDAIVGDLRAAGLTADVSPTALPDQFVVIARR